MPRHNNRRPPRVLLNVARSLGVGLCPCGKVMFATKDLAVTALIAARHTRSVRKPRRVVRCDWSDSYHLTSDGRRT